MRLHAVKCTKCPKLMIRAAPDVCGCGAVDETLHHPHLSAAGRQSGVRL